MAVWLDCLVAWLLGCLVAKLLGWLVGWLVGGCGPPGASLSVDPTSGPTSGPQGLMSTTGGDDGCGGGLGGNGNHKHFQ